VTRAGLLLGLLATSCSGIGMSIDHGASALPRSLEGMTVFFEAEPKLGYDDGCDEGERADFDALVPRAMAQIRTVLADAGAELVADPDAPHDVYTHARIRLNDCLGINLFGLLSLTLERNGRTIGDAADPYCSHLECAVAVAQRLVRSTKAVERSGEPGPIAVAVLAIEDSANAFDAMLLDQLGDYLAAKLGEMPGVRVVPGDAQEAEDAAKSLATKLLRVGETCVLTASLVDRGTGASERSASSKADCTGGALIGAVDEVLAQLRPAE
jgi:hypothetical protein